MDKRQKKSTEEAKTLAESKQEKGGQERIASQEEKSKKTETVPQEGMAKTNTPADTATHDETVPQDLSSDGMTTEIVTTQTVVTTTSTKIMKTEVQGGSRAAVLKGTISPGNSLKNTTIQPSPSRKKSGIPLTDEEFEQQCLEAHNTHRKKHGVPPLKLSEDLCRYAKEWADNLAHEDTLQGRQSNKYGENLFAKWSSNPSYELTGTEVVDSWYSTIGSFVFGEEPTMLKAGQFTQIVWKNSEELGVAQAKSKSGKIYVVANYAPPGNIMGSFNANVMPAE